MADANDQLAPPTAELFSAEIGSCLALVGGVGMSRDDRNEWIQAAGIALSGIPADLLKRGCDVARRFADHPSKIVPTIEREVRETWNRRLENRGKVVRLLAASKASDPLPPEERCTPEQAAEIIKRVGLNLNVGDGRRETFKGSDEMRKRMNELDATNTESQAAPPANPLIPMNAKEMAA